MQQSKFAKFIKKLDQFLRIISKQCASTPLIDSQESSIFENIYHKITSNLLANPLLEVHELWAMHLKIVM